MNINYDNPGAVQFGNFINYYQFNSAEERIKLLPTIEVWCNSQGQINADSLRNPYLVLDVGCNSGVFTKLLYKFLQGTLPHRTIYIYAVDIDIELINSARAGNSYSSITFECCNIMNADDFLKIYQFVQKHNRSHFDAICCFSITMWIHLNHNDKGLQDFLKKLSDIAMLLVVEAQPWKCYQAAQRRLHKVQKNFELFHQLKWKTNVVESIERYIEEILHFKKIYETPLTKWKRNIRFYRRDYKIS